MNLWKIAQNKRAAGIRRKAHGNSKIYIRYRRRLLSPHGNARQSRVATDRRDNGKLWYFLLAYYDIRHILKAL